MGEPSAAGYPGLRRAISAAGVVHPFPSVLDGVVVAVVAFVATSPPGRAAALGLSMVLLQFAIGALNDVADAARDHGRADKPVAAGLLAPRLVQSLAVACALAGVLTAALAGPVLLAPLALVGLAIGAWYDLAAKGTRLSWLPLALGVPLLPVYGWYGAVGSLPSAFGILVPAAALGGAALAIANAAVDIERDEAVGATSLSVALGARRSALASLGLQLAVAVLAVGSASRLGATGNWLAFVGGAALLPIAGAAIGVASAGRARWGREAAFEVQALGLALLAVAWVAAAGMTGR